MIIRVADSPSGCLILFPDQLVPLVIRIPSLFSVLIRDAGDISQAVVGVGILGLDILRSQTVRPAAL